jgi:hypothetical protein
MSAGPSITYKLKWFIPNELVDNIRGVERTYRISVEFRRPVKVGRLQLKLPLRRGMRTDDAESHQNLIYRLNRHIGKDQQLGIQTMKDLTETPVSGEPLEESELTIAVPPFQRPIVRRLD